MEWVQNVALAARIYNISAKICTANKIVITL